MEVWLPDKGLRRAGIAITPAERRQASLAYREEHGIPCKPRKDSRRRNSDGSPITDEQLIDHLKRLLAKHGYLPASLIADARDIPAKNLFRRRFGGLRLAYARAGYFGYHSDIVRAALHRISHMRGRPEEKPG